MKRIAVALLCFASARALPQVAAPNGNVLKARVDTLAVFFIEGNDTTRSGSIRDEIRFVEMGGSRCGVLGVASSTLTSG